MAKPETMDELAARLVKLPTTQKLLVAIALIEKGQLENAETVIELALRDMQGKRLLGIQRAPLS